MSRLSTVLPRPSAPVPNLFYEPGRVQAYPRPLFQSIVRAAEVVYARLVARSTLWWGEAT